MSHNSIYHFIKSSIDLNVADGCKVQDTVASAGCLHADL